MATRPPTPPPSDGARLNQQLRRLVLLGLVAANLLVGLVAGYMLLHSRKHYEERAQNLTQNVTKALEVNISKSLDAIDLTLLTVVDALEAQLAGKGIDEAQTKVLLARLEGRVPAIEAIRVSRADGVVILGKRLNKKAQVSWADRDDFIHHRDHADGGLQITQPRVGRVAEKYIIGISRRYNHPDGRFAGTVSAPVGLDHFTQMLAQYDVGSKGTLILRDNQRRLITRMPPLPNNPAGAIGNQVMSADFRKVFDEGQANATGYTSASPDGYQRIFTFQHIKRGGMVAIVATADVDYLMNWRQELYRTLAMLVGFMVLSLTLGGVLQRLLLRAQRDAEQLSESQVFVTTVLNSMKELVAVIDAKGRITAVNTAWLDFAVGNGDTELDKVSVGANYVQVCPSKGEGGVDDAGPVRSGIQAVLDGRQPAFTWRYPCHSPQDERWFVLHVLPLAGARRGAVLIHQNVTEAHQAEARLKASEERFRLLFDTSLDGIMITAPDGQIFAANRAACTMLQRTEQDICQVGRDGVVDPTDPGLAMSLEERQLKGKTAGERIFVRKDGSKFHCDVSSAIYQDGGGNVISSVVFRDITERKKMLDAIQESQARMSAMFQFSPEAMVLTRVSDGVILDVNDAALKLFGYPRDAVVGHRSVEDLAVYVDPAQRDAVISQLQAQGTVHNFEVDYRTHDGRFITLALSGRIVEVQGEPCTLAVMVDVTERKLTESKIRDLAFQDALTQLPNRRLLFDRLDQAMASTRRNGLQGALMYVDMDNFKPLNDSHGHETGDVLLVEASRRLRACVRDMDTVARVGGDEFVVVLSELSADVSVSCAQAHAVADKILLALSAPYVLPLASHGPTSAQSGCPMRDLGDDVVVHHCTASIGVALFSGDSVGHKDILSWADAAMYQAKHAGRNGIRFHTPDAVGGQK